MGNAEAERAFSVHNRIKTKARVHLKIIHLDRLVRLSYAKIPIGMFNFDDAAVGLNIFIFQLEQYI